MDMTCLRVQQVCRTDYRVYVCLFVCYECVYVYLYMHACVGVDVQILCAGTASMQVSLCVCYECMYVYVHADLPACL